MKCLVNRLTPFCVPSTVLCVSLTSFSRDSNLFITASAINSDFNALPVSAYTNKSFNFWAISLTALECKFEYLNRLNTSAGCGGKKLQNYTTE